MFNRRIPGLLTALTLTALAALALTAKPAQAQTTVYSTFGPSNSFDNDGNELIAGPSSLIGAVSLGVPFTVSQSGSLFSITAAYAFDTGTAAGHLYLTDNVTKLNDPADALESLTLTILPPYHNPAPVVFTSVLNPTLTVGTTYYLYAMETSNTVDGFFINDQGVRGTIYYGDPSSPPSPSVQLLPAFSV